MKEEGTKRGEEDESKIRYGEIEARERDEDWEGKEISSRQADIHVLVLGI